MHSEPLAYAPGAASASNGVHVFSLTAFSLASADFGDDAVLIDAAPPLRLLPPQPLSMIGDASCASGAGLRARPLRPQVGLPAAPAGLGQRAGGLSGVNRDFFDPARIGHEKSVFLV